MSEINPISPSYPINKPKKIDPERDTQDQRKKQQENQKKNEKKGPDDQSDPLHIDEIV